jgi:radical SAM protein with 4Fe4S-binding SPASM domain
LLSRLYYAIVNLQGRVAAPDRESFLMPQSLPVHIDIDLSSKCNLRCSFCHLSYFTPKDQSSQISIDEFETKIVPMLPHLESITLFSKYEVLTCRDFPEIYRRIREFNVDTYFSTNGILLSDEVLDVIVGHLHYLTVSVTGFTRERYLKFMRSDQLHVVEANLEKLNRLKAERNTPYPILRISTVGMQDTLEDLPSAVDFAKKHKAEEGVQFTSLYVYEEDTRHELPAADIDRYNRLTDAALAYAAEKNVKLVLQSGSMDDNARATEDLGHKYCDLPWKRLSIQSNGDVYPCPVAYKPLGNFHKQTLQEIWDGEAMATFRLGVNDLENMNEDCRNCIHCRHRTIVDPKPSDFSDAKELYGGMTRKEARHRAVQ